MLFFKQWPVSYNTPYEKIGDEVRSLVDLAPFEIPSSWEWCRVGDLFSNMSGLAYKKDALAIKTDKMVRVLRGGNIGEEQFCFKNDDVFISSELVKPELYLRKNYMITPAVSSLDHIGKIALIDKDYSDTVVGGFVLMLIPHFNDDVVSQYLLYAFAAKHHRDNCRNITHKSGQAFYNLSREQMMNLPVPIPPREEMERITAMLKRVLPKVADYAVVDIALQKLNSSFPEALKKSILQEAVQGKLVPQDPSDEPAEALLERIRTEKQRLIKEGKIKKDKHESVIFRRDNSHYEKLDGVVRCIDEELPFEIPETWAWVRIGTILSVSSGDSLTVAQMNSAGSIPVYGGNGIAGTHDKWNVCHRTLVIGRVGYYCGATHITEPFAWVTDNAFITHFDEELLQMKWLKFLIDYLEPRKRASSTAQPVISGKLLYPMLVPIPPLNEQHRIVQRIEELLTMVKGL